MSGLYDDSNRQVMPRWYPFWTACQLGDLEPDTTRETPKLESPASIIQKVKDWREKRTIPHALELVGTALIAGDFLNPDGNEAAAFILESQEPPKSLGRQIAEVYKSDRTIHNVDSIKLPADDLQHRFEIAHFKDLLQRYPRNAIAWADLAFHYTLLGQRKRAEHCMGIAISLGRDNRFILRSAARCFLHLGQPDKSLFHLRRSPLSKIDPWLASAEIAISEGIGNNAQFVRLAQAMISDRDLSPWSINELAATLSTLEARHGSASKSKRLLLKALQQPNENTMAQAEWLAPVLRYEVARPDITVLAMYEADARRSFRDANFGQALERAKEWFQFQPFTSRPALLASYIAAVCLQNDQEAIEIILKAKATSPENFLLHNNHAFSLASLGRITESEKVIASIDESTLTAKEQKTLAATKGLVEFRRGNTSEGRELYKKAIEGFKNMKEHRSAAIATLFWAREETLIHSPLEDAALKAAKELANKYGIKELIKYADILAGKKQVPSSR
jgi:Flp pilus assembly protein TadD